MSCPISGTGGHRTVRCNDSVRYMVGIRPTPTIAWCSHSPRSVGCTVIELLEGKPPYHFLDPMPALFRIVQDDCPPIPEGASPVVKDFLYHCFQKDCNLRISAKKLLRHPWMVAARKQMAGHQKEKASEARNGAAPQPRPPSNYNYDEAVLKVQEWNEALKCESLSNPRMWCIVSCSSCSPVAACTTSGAPADDVYRCAPVADPTSRPHAFVAEAHRRNESISGVVRPNKHAQACGAHHKQGPFICTSSRPHSRNAPDAVYLAAT